MPEIIEIYTIVKITLFGLCIFLASMYSLLILLVPRFYHRLNMLTVNICIAMICCSTYWAVYFIMYQYDIEDLFTLTTCNFLFYVQTISSCQVPYSFTVLTINRFFIILYPTRVFFKSKIFLFICITSQWILSCILSLPFSLSMGQVKKIFHNYTCELLLVVFLVLFSSTLVMGLLYHDRHHISNNNYTYSESLHIQTCSFFITSNSSTKRYQLNECNHG